MKKMITVLLAVLILSGFTSYARGKDNTILEKSYKKIISKIENISRDDKAVKFTVKDENGNESELIVNETLFVNLEDAGIYKDLSSYEEKVKKLEKGDEIVAFISNKAPMTRSIPPQVSPKLIATNPSKVYSVDLDYYMDNNIGAADRLVINGTDNCDIKTIDGDVYKEKISGHELLVLYKVSTRSLPPQTNPEIIRVMDVKKVAEEDYTSILKKNIKALTINGIEQYPIRQFFELIGFQVSWDAKNATIIIKAEGKEIKIDSKNSEFKVGEEKVKISNFSLTKGRTYADEQFFKDIETLIKK